MKLLNFSKHTLLILAVSAIAFQSCKKDAAPELADTFVAKYTGTYTSGGNGGSISLDNAPASITKKSATTVGIELTLFGLAFTINGNAKNDTLVEIPVQAYGPNGQIPTAGTCVVKNGNITMKFPSKTTSSSGTVSTGTETYIGKKL
jgi:hypothetical protein